MRGVDCHVEWGFRRREPSLDVLRSGGGRVKRKSTVKLRGTTQQDGELPMRPAGQTQSAENNDKRTPMSVSMITPNPEAKRKAFVPFIRYQDQGDPPEHASIRNRRQDRRLHDQVVNEAAETVARVESSEELSTPFDCNDGTSSRYEFLRGTGDPKARNFVHSSPPDSLYSLDCTPGFDQTSNTDSTPLTCVGYDSDGHSVWSTRRDRHENIATPSPTLTSVRTSREAKMPRDYSKRLEHLEATSASTPCHAGDLDISTFEYDDREETTQRGPPLVDLINRMSPLSSIAQVVTSIPKECKSRFDKMKSEGWQPNIQTPFNEIKRAARSMTKVSAPDALAAPAALKDDDSMGPGNIFNNLSLNAEDMHSRDEAVVWSDKEDRQLLSLKKANNIWSDIASILEKSQGECKQRFKTIKPEDWKTIIAKEKESRGKDAEKQKGPIFPADVAGSKASVGRSEAVYQDLLFGQWGIDFGECDFPKPPSVEDGWGRASEGDLPWDWSLPWEWSQPSTNAVPKPEIAPYQPCRVTYWATIESGGSEIKIPICSGDVSGPEKTIATQDLPKVWKWVHDKGLGDKVGLQDAFDLARSMHKNDFDDDAFMDMGCGPWGLWED